MYLLLVVIILRVAMISAPQFTEQSLNTSEADGHPTQTNSTLNTPYNIDTFIGLQEQAKPKEHLQSNKSHDTITTLNGGEIQQSSITSSTSAEDLQKVTVYHTTVPNKEFLEYVSHSTHNNHDSTRTVTTQHSLNSQTTSQYEISSVHKVVDIQLHQLSQYTPFKDFIALTIVDISLCFQGIQYPYFKSKSGTISYYHKNFDKKQLCAVDLVVPYDMVIQMFIFLNTSPCPAACPHYQYCPGRPLSLYDPKANFYKRFGCYHKAFRVVTTGNSVTFYLEAFPANVSMELSINFTARSPPQLQIISITSTTGYVQSPDWDGITNYPSHLDVWTRLDVPPNCKVMISFFSMDIQEVNGCFDSLTITEEKGKADGQSVELTYCNYKPDLKPTIFHANALKFRFVSHDINDFLGFRLYFSFHNQSEIPEKLHDGKWNCSVPYWPQFKLHFNCNIAVDCFGEEDELHCGYADNGCDKGFLSIGSRCYKLITGEDYITWNEAANECIRRDAYLASLNSPEEWEEVTKAVKAVAQRTVYFGLQASGAAFPYLYRDGFQWADGSFVSYANVLNNYYDGSIPRCSVISRKNWHTTKLFLEQCNKNMTTSFLCEKNMQRDDPQEKPQDIVLHPLQWHGNGDNYVTCPSGHATLTILACDPQTACWAGRTDVSTTACEYSGKPPPPSLQCMSGVDSVPYTLVCDHRPDCSDSSDENFCVFPSCKKSGMFQCTNKQCVSYDKWCDKIPHCLDGSDETQCPWYYRGGMSTPKPPAIIHFNGYGSYEVKPLVTHTIQNKTSMMGVCPETHFLCPGNLTYCMPVFVRCNGVYDCPGRQDEDGCDRYQCPGYYRCRASPICVHASHLCDGVFQCPQHDDELLCEATCPQNCTCQGLAFYCHGQFPAEQYQELRFLHAPESRLSPMNLKLNSLLIYLNLTKCSLNNFNDVKYPNLRILDLSYNKLMSFRTTHLTNIHNLQKLSLAGNPLKFSFLTEHDSVLQFPLLQSLDLSNVSFSGLNITMLTIFPNIVFLNLSACRLTEIAGEGFQSLAFLRYLDLRGCPITQFSKNIFNNLNDLNEVWADNYKLCCQETLPKGFPLANCHSPSDEISSCYALLRSDFYRVVLSVFAALALIGNLGSFVYRAFISTASSNLGFDVFVTNLCVSDFLMGVYLAVIGIADRMYQGNYLWKDEEWKQSAGCKVAGFLSLLSSEVSAFLICLITLDRFTVLQFPFSKLHFKRKSAHIACMVVWLIGIVIAGIPLLPFTEHWKFYSQNGICIPLPITRNRSDGFAGHTYSFSLIIIVNFILFSFIAVGQIFIFWSVRSHRMSAGDFNRKSNDLVIACRLITVAMSDFLCWFPIGLLGLLASNDMSIPGEVNVAIAIIVLPVNSAINPFLYTINRLLEKQRKANEEKLQKMIMSSFASKHTESTAESTAESYSRQEALRLLSKWLSLNLVSRQNVEVVLNAQEKQKTFENKTK